MLWWLAGLWLVSPVLVPFFWLLGCLRRNASTSGKTRATGHSVADRIMRDQRFHPD